MHLSLKHCVLGTAFGTALTLGLGGCSGAGSEPSEADMKDALLYAMNHPPGVTVSDPVTITFFKKEACDKPTEQGFRCTYDLQVASRNALAGMWANVPFGFFYRDKDRGGKWNMRPPF